MLETMRGACTCCGQWVELELEHNPSMTADSKATMLCDCSDAKKLQKDHEHEIAVIQRREETLKNSKDAIRKMFGKTENEDHAAMPEATQDFLVLASAMVYDGLIGNLNLNLSQGAKAKIGRKKDGLKIERQNTDGKSIEI